MTLPAGDVVSDQLVVEPFKQTRQSVYTGLLPCGNPERASSCSKGCKLVLKRELTFSCRATYVTRYSYKLGRLFHLPSGDSVNHRGVSAVISYIFLAMRFLPRIGHSTKRASGKEPKE